MKKKMDNDAKERIISAALQLVDLHGGASHVNLREVARKVSCSAPNIYNYFHSLDELLNSVLFRICEDYENVVQEKTSQVKEPEELLFLSFKTYIEYALEYPGRLNFFHFEKLNIHFSCETEEAAQGVGNRMADLLDLGTKHKVPEYRIHEICDLLHRYLIGEMSEFITGRTSIENKEEYVNQLVSYCRRLFEVLVHHLKEEK